MHRLSNTLIGFLNLFTLLASIPIIGAGLWMARKSSTCQSFLQTPLLAIGIAVLVISLAGFLGACFRVAWVLWIYLVIMLLLIALLIGVAAFGFVVTSAGGGAQVPGRVYKEYHLMDYSVLLRKKMMNPVLWNTIRSCLLDSQACAKVQNWTAVEYMKNDLTPIQSGCCKPPTSCNYGPTTAMVAQDPDCSKWNNAQDILCYECDSCKAGVLETIRREWHKLAVINGIILVVLICIYCVGCCAFKSTRRAQGYPYGHHRMMKFRPRWDYY